MSKEDAFSYIDNTIDICEELDDAVEEYLEHRRFSNTLECFRSESRHRKLLRWVCYCCRPKCNGRPNCGLLLRTTSRRVAQGLKTRSPAALRGSAARTRVPAPLSTYLLRS